MPKSKGTLPEFSPITGERTPVWAHAAMSLPQTRNSYVFGALTPSPDTTKYPELLARYVAWAVEEIAKHPDLDWSTLVITYEPDTSLPGHHHLVAQATTKEATPA
jgi:hypothetical protein